MTATPAVAGSVLRRGVCAHHEGLVRHQGTHGGRAVRVHRQAAAQEEGGCGPPDGAWASG